MSEFVNIFNRYTMPSNSCWRRHCDQNTDDCAINPSSQMKSEVRQFFNIDNDEEILFIRDTSFWNERNQGTVITDKYYYLVPDNDKPSEGVFFAWRDIQQVTYNDATIYFWQNDNINEANNPTKMNVADTAIHAKKNLKVRIIILLIKFNSL